MKILCLAIGILLQTALCFRIRNTRNLAEENNSLQAGWLCGHSKDSKPPVIGHSLRRDLNKNISSSDSTSVKKSAHQARELKITGKGRKLSGFRRNHRRSHSDSFEEVEFLCRKKSARTELFYIFNIGQGFTPTNLSKNKQADLSDCDEFMTDKEDIDVPLVDQADLRNNKGDYYSYDDLLD